MTDVLPNGGVSNEVLGSVVEKEDKTFKAPLLSDAVHNAEEKSLQETDVSSSIPLPHISVVAPSLDYVPPPWASKPSNVDDYAFDVIKNGSLLETIKFSKRRAPTFIVIGRLATCDIQLEHPSISRYHCILQFGEDIMDRTGKGWHIYDLGSTHGTKLNKHRIPPKQYIRIRVGHVMQFGGSSRIMNLVGPEDDVEAEWEYSPTEMKRLKKEKKLDAKLKSAAKEGKIETEKTNEEDEHSSGSDYDEEALYARMREDFNAEENEAKYQKDPLKALSHFFEQEGFDMEFSFTEFGSGRTHKWTCSIELPVDTAAGQSLSATASCFGTKKEAQIACALNACRILDMHGVLYRSSTLRRRKQKNLEENDFYDSDEDTFFDRTGQVERSRENRKRWALEAQGRFVEEKETYESLLKKIAVAEEQIRSIESRLAKLSGKGDVKNEVVEENELDAFCHELLSSGEGRDPATKTERSQLRLRLTEIKHEKEKMEKLAKIAKPVALPELIVATKNLDDAKKSTTVSAETMKKFMMLRRAKAKVGVLGAAKAITETKNIEDKPFVVEEEEDDEAEKKAEGGTIGSSVRGPRLEEIPSFATEASTSEAVDINVKAVEERVRSSNIEERSLKKEPGLSKQEPESSKEEPKFSNNELEPPKREKYTNTFGTGNEGEPASVSLEAELPTKRRRIRVRGERIASKGQDVADYGEGSANRDETYVTWMPPDEQSGDGKTALNAKFAGRY